MTIILENIFAKIHNSRQIANRMMATIHMLLYGYFESLLWLHVFVFLRSKKIDTSKARMIKDKTKYNIKKTNPVSEQLQTIIVQLIVSLKLIYANKRYVITDKNPKLFKTKIINIINAYCIVNFKKQKNTFFPHSADRIDLFEKFINV